MLFDPEQSGSNRVKINHDYKNINYINNIEIFPNDTPGGLFSLVFQKFT